MKSREGKKMIEQNYEIRICIYKFEYYIIITPTQSNVKSSTRNSYIHNIKKKITRQFGILLLLLLCYNSQIEIDFSFIYLRCDDDDVDDLQNVESKRIYSLKRQTKQRTRKAT